MINIFSFLSGLLFSLGLVIAGMANPAKVLAFLDVAGRWDPSLALVMAGAIAVGLIAFVLVKERQTSLLGVPMQLPGASHIDKRLVLGSVLFGVGWGLAGICPGPALVLVGAGSIKGLCFVAAMLVGMGTFEAMARRAPQRH